jgi:ATP-dependent RNA helicase DDX3X
VFGKPLPHPIRPLLITDSYTIIDEADEMLHVDWEEDMAKIMSGGGKKNTLTCLSKRNSLSPDTNEDGDHRYLLFSATFSKDMRKLARKYLSIDHIRIRIGRAGSAHGNIKQQVSAYSFSPRRRTHRQIGFLV